jgi:NAD+ diphosphatase
MDHLQRSRLNLFSSRTLDRATFLRPAEAQLADIINSPSCRFVPVLGTNVLVNQEETRCRAGLLAPSELHECFGHCDEHVYLGQGGGTHYFAAIVGKPSSRAGEFADLRTYAAVLDEDQAALLSYARAMVIWRHNHRYCGACGAPTRPRLGGHVLECSQIDCGREHYPRTDPAIIVLVEKGEQALFGRKAEWPENRYSTIAGFIEPGESAEQAVVREVAEETGVEVTAMHYHSSQPWPFPGSLMLGYTATAGSDAISLNDNELEDARWLTRDQISEKLALGEFQLPTSISISSRLIEDWFNKKSDQALRTLRERYQRIG